jgi:hypothetical protein
MNINASERTVLYISTVGEFEFLDPKGPRGLAERVWRALLTLKNTHRLNVMVSLHPLLSSDDTAVLAPSEPTEPECVDGGASTCAREAGSLGLLSLQEALRSEGMLVPRSRYLSFMPLLDQADIVIAPISSGGKGVVLHSPATPLVLLRPQVAWNGNNVSRVATQNEGLVLGNETAAVLDEGMQAADLVEAITRELSALAPHTHQLCAGDDGTAATGCARAAAREAHRKYWFGHVDGYEELRTWLALLSSRVEGFRSSETFANLTALYASTLVASASHGGVLASALDHPLMDQQPHFYPFFKRGKRSIPLPQVGETILARDRYEAGAQRARAGAGSG